MKIITSKVMIPTEMPRVCRQGLLDTLRENLKSSHTTVINGRAGTGKTMLAVDFIRRHERGRPGIKWTRRILAFRFFWSIWWSVWLVCVPDSAVKLWTVTREHSGVARLRP